MVQFDNIHPHPSLPSDAPPNTNLHPHPEAGTSHLFESDDDDPYESDIDNVNDVAISTLQCHGSFNEEDDFPMDGNDEIYPGEVSMDDDNDLNGDREMQ